MTDKLHCPFCGAELEVENIWAMPVCPNKSCQYYRIKIPETIWQALIDGKRAQDMLKVATDALSKIDTFNCHSKGAMEIIAGMTSIANRALYEITSITKQGE